MLDGCDVPGGADECLRSGLGRIVPPPGTTALVFGGRCAPGADPYDAVCDRGALLHSLEVALYGAEVTVEDRVPPLVGAPATALADGAWHGTGELAAIASDATDATGIRSLAVTIGGAVVAGEDAPGAAAGGCGEPGAGLAYTFAAPCLGGRGLDAGHELAVALGDAVPQGTRALRVEATDAAGNVMASEPVAVRIDTGAPPAPAVAADERWSPAPGFAWSPPAESDRAPLVAAEVEACAGAAATACRVAPGLGALAEGLTRVRVRLLDAAGNVGAWSAPVTLRRDATPPPAPAIAAVSTGAQLTPSVDAADSVSGVASVTVEVRVDGGDWAPAPAAVLATPGHAYAFRARATDRAGNTGDWAQTDELAVPAGPGRRPRRPRHPRTRPPPPPPPPACASRPRACAAPRSSSPAGPPRGPRGASRCAHVCAARDGRGRSRDARGSARDAGRRAAHAGLGDERRRLAPLRRTPATRARRSGAPCAASAWA